MFGRLWQRLGSAGVPAMFGRRWRLRRLGNVLLSRDIPNSFGDVSAFLVAGAVVQR